MRRGGVGYRGGQPLSPARNHRKRLGFLGGRTRSRLALFPPFRLGVVRRCGRQPPAMLTVREVAVELAVCRATVYALLECGELERVWVGRSIRIPAASLEAFLAQNQRQGPAGRGRFPVPAPMGDRNQPS